eukprot:3858108-Alexandrium_andersonii.AAC.1
MRRCCTRRQPRQKQTNVRVAAERSGAREGAIAQLQTEPRRSSVPAAASGGREGNAAQPPWATVS